MAAYYLVFSELLNLRTGEYAFEILVGLAIVRWFGGAFTGAAGSITGAAGLMNLVNVRKIVFPLIQITSQSIKSGIVISLLAAALWVTGHGQSVEAYLYLPLVLVATGLVILGVSLCYCAFVPFVADLGNLVGTLNMLVMFLSGVFFTIDMMPADVQPYFYLNPLACSIEMMRSIMISGLNPNVDRLAYVATFGAVLTVLGWQIIGFFDKVYPKVVVK
jgi:lipopolysaccharide transport system permease protein